MVEVGGKEETKEQETYLQDTQRGQFSTLEANLTRWPFSRLGTALFCGLTDEVPRGVLG